MHENPFEPTSASETKNKAKRSSWLLIAGASFLVLAAISILLAAAGMISTFNEITTSSKPLPAELAGGINRSSWFAIPAAPLAVIGVVLIAVGFIRRNHIR